MTLRRFAGLLTSALMMHLNAAAGGATCGTHSESGRAPTASATEHSAGSARMAEMAAMMGSAAQHEQHGDAPCHVPSQATCCQAMASCSVAFVSSGAGSAGSAFEHPAIPGAAVDAPQSVIAAPDPPPPKA